MSIPSTSEEVFLLSRRDLGEMIRRWLRVGLTATFTFGFNF